MRTKPRYLVYAATKRCSCGAGLAYDRRAVRRNPSEGVWDCSAILLGTADASKTHTAKLPFSFYEIKPENKERGTTRP